MALVELHGQDPLTSGALSISGQVRVANPFDAASLTLTEIVNATAEDWAGFYIFSNSGTGSSGILSVFKGSIGSEVRVASIPTKVRFGKTGYFCIYVPIPLPAGTRLSIGISANTGLTKEFQIAGVPSSNFDAEPSYTVMDCGPFNLENLYETYGSSPSLDPGGTANAKGPYFEISELGVNGSNNLINGDSLAFAYDRLGFLFTDRSNGTQTAQRRLFDVAHGALASENVFIGDFNVAIDKLEVGSLLSVFWIPWGRAAGDRISAKMQSSIIDPIDRLGEILMFGLR